MPRQMARIATVLTALFVALVAAPASAADRYRNPVPATIPATGDRVETLADPDVIHGRDGSYYAYRTTDPLIDRDRDAAGALRAHHIPTLRSTDLVHWSYVGDAFKDAPAWLEPGSPQWAPDVRYLSGRYVLFYTGTDTTDAVSGEPGCAGDSAIGAATSASPTGPWKDVGHPVVAPRRHGPGCDFLWTFDPAVVTDAAGHAYLYYGSYFGGLWVTRVAEDGLTATGQPTQVAINDRYEGSYVVRHGSWFDHSIVDENHPSLPAPRGFRLTPHANEASEGRACTPPLSVRQLARRILAAPRLCRTIQAGQHADQGVHRRGRHNPELGISR